MFSAIGHFVLVDGVRKFRIWMQADGEYMAETMNEKEFLRQRMRNRLEKIFSERRGGAIRDLTETGWWSRERQPAGKPTMLVAEGDPHNLDLNASAQRAFALAHIAEAAVNAYEEYLADGGDPEFWPEMAYDSTAKSFKVQ